MSIFWDSKIWIFGSSLGHGLVGLAHGRSAYKSVTYKGLIILLRPCFISSLFSIFCFHLMENTEKIVLLTVSKPKLGFEGTCWKRTYFFEKTWQSCFPILKTATKQGLHFLTLQDPFSYILMDMVHMYASVVGVHI